MEESRLSKIQCSKCNGTEFSWQPAINEKGWFCCECNAQPGEPPGYCPELDRQEIARKVDALLLALHDYDFTCVSNGSTGDWIVGATVHWCKDEGYYDQAAILQRLLRYNDGVPGSEEEGPNHSNYWKKVGDGVLGGKDPRSRCPCGALATRSRTYQGETTYACNEHPFAGGDEPF